VFTEAELKAFLRPKPKKKGNSIPRHLVGSSYRAPLCPECFSHRPAVDVDLLKAILEAECGWLRDEDAAFTSAAPVPRAFMKAPCLTCRPVLIGAATRPGLGLLSCSRRRLDPEPKHLDMQKAFMRCSNEDGAALYRSCSPEWPMPNAWWPLHRTEDGGRTGAN
jgi:hypothetical protein